MAESAKTPPKQQDEGKSVLSGKEEFAGAAEEKLSKMGEKTREAQQEPSPAKPQRP